MPQRAKDWLAQAKKRPKAGQILERFWPHEWACFIAQQGAEKAVKVLHLHLRQHAWGHVVAKLLRELPTQFRPDDELLEKAKVLDNFYIPTRHPNGHPEGAPFEHYGPLQSEEAITYAGEIIGFVGDKMAD